MRELIKQVYTRLSLHTKAPILWYLLFLRFQLKAFIVNTLEKNELIIIEFAFRK